MRVFVNDQIVQCQTPDEVTVHRLVAQHTGRELRPDGSAADGSRLGLAVARNGEVVPRASWASTRLADGDRLDIVTAVQGG
ncbi:sulfur carrier protein ThiS [Acaricomes phytoseiuli]|uniref:sulfur carrier protein ThiS n=1 Tax=Acaricomes phytoseiuli TaxID=291968 RepID=UPI0003725253|nr:sulfur carrier protein ThiS [Acaricomes phytoseiuli]MCW1249033.1 sulfur carrier protein ThiS [Acaricomes phytoseiuli]